MITENLSTLKIHKLTQEQYNTALANGNIDENALYLTPDEEQYTNAEIDSKLSAKADATHTHTINNVTNLQTTLDTYATQVALDEAVEGIETELDTYETKSDATIKLDTAKAYADTAASTAASNVKNELLNGAGAAYDTLKELGDLIDENQDAIEALETIAAGKADAGHNHNDVYYTETEIDTKVSEINGAIEDITDGTTVVAKASHAINADSATNATNAEKAIQDASGNIITSTYETKTDATTKLDTAKAYTDTAKSDLIGGAGTNYNTLKKLGDMIDDLYDVKQNNITGAATTITSSNLTTSRALISNGSGKVAVSDITSTELGYLDGVKSNIQTQINTLTNTANTLETKSDASAKLTEAKNYAKEYADSLHETSTIIIREW